MVTGMYNETLLYVMTLFDILWEAFNTSEKEIKIQQFRL
jgi:hypothetical protein